jgi:hypothetical protein
LSIVDLTYGKDCGGYTNELIYVSGPLSDPSLPQGADLSQLTVNEVSGGEMAISGLLSDPLWAGSHTIKILSRNGVQIEASNRGQKGLFGSAESKSFTFVVKHPCETSEFLEWQIDTVEVNLKGDSKEITLIEPLDQASLDYGDKDGLTLCGKRSLSIVTPASDYESFLTFDGDNKLTLKAT